ncbi:MAG TPA: response regulator, partial [Gammaproteobacteria bacterium]|nr:response regulator [Gammaproteobacteria bacterium]
NRTETFITEALHYLSEETNKNGDLGTAAAQKQTAISGRKKILLADDNADMRAYIRKMLSLQYEVLLAENGKKALELARSSKVDLILSDIMMPEMDGIELLTAIRADANLKTLPVILLSARAGEEAKASGIEMGADDYLVKPFSAMELQARIQTQLSLSDMRTTLLRDLAASNRELESFSYSVSHDLRAPLRNINGLSEILLEEYSDKLDEQGKKYLKRIRLASKRMGQIIDDLLRLAKIAHSELRRETINLSELVNKICDGFKSETIDRNIDFLIARDIMVEGDRGLLQTALENLLSNAIKFTAKHASARIEFGMQEQDGKQVYFIRDDGAGFDSIYSTRLFRVFQRLHRNDEFAGTGVGLATTLRVIERHGGRIWAEGAIEKGATFYFTL